MNFFRTLCNKILEKFFKKQSQNKDIVSELIADESLKNEDVSLLDVKSETENFNKEQHNYDNISVGDIILGNRVSGNQKHIIPEGHEIGPYIVLGKNEEGLICSSGTSVVPSEYNMNNFYMLDFSEYDLDKNTYFKLKNLEVIDESRYIHKIDSLNNQEQEEFLRNIKAKNSNYYFEKGTRKTYDVEIEIGDIILYNDNHYIILGIQNNEYICVRTNNTRIHLTNNDVKYLNYLELKNISIDKKVVYMGTLNSNLLKYVLKREQEYLANYQNQNIVQRGSILLKHNELKYVYGEEGQNWLIFDIYKHYKDDNDAECMLDEINIRNKKYYTKYLNSILDKKEELTPVALAFEEEIDAIKVLKKSYKKRKKKNDLHKQKEIERLVRKKGI